MIGMAKRSHQDLASAVTLTFDIAADEHADEKREILQARGLSLSQQFYPSGTISADILNVLRVCAFGQEELYFYNALEPLAFVSPINEMAVLRNLKRRLRAELARPEVASDAQTSACLSHNLSEAVALCNAFAAPGEVPDHLLADADAAAFAAWMKNEGVDLPLRLAHFAGIGRGLATTRALAEGEVFRLPRSLIFNVDTARADPLVGAALKAVQQAHELDDDTILLLYTIREASRPQSRFYPYFRLLPREISNGALLPVQALLELEGLPALPEIVEVRERLRELHEQLFPMLSEKYPELFPTETFSLEEFVWARAVYDSRAFQIGFDGQVKNCLLPFIDFLNSRPRAHIEGRGQFDAAANAYQFRTLCAVPANTQLYLNYGAFNNREQLMQFGFVFADNPYDNIPLWFDLPDDEFQAAKSALIERFHLRNANLIRQGPLPAKLLAMLRVSLLDATELAGATSAGPAFSPFRRVSARNEREALLALRATLDSLLEEVLSANPAAEGGVADQSGSDAEGGEEDAEVKEAEEPDESLQGALAYRSSYVAMLRFNIEQVDAQLATLPG